MDNLNTSILAELAVPLLPLAEQKAIVAFGDVKSAEIQTAITRIQREIDLIEEYHTTLIASAVTGQIDVRTDSHQFG